MISNTRTGTVASAFPAWGKRAVTAAKDKEKFIAALLLLLPLLATSYLTTHASTTHTASVAPKPLQFGTSLLRTGPNSSPLLSSTAGLPTTMAKPSLLMRSTVPMQFSPTSGAHSSCMRGCKSERRYLNSMSLRCRSSGGGVTGDKAMGEVQSREGVRTAEAKKVATEKQIEQRNLVIADLFRQNEEVKALLTSLETEIVAAIKLGKESSGGGQGDSIEEDERLSELLEMRAMLREQLLPVAQQIEELKQSTAASIAKQIGFHMTSHSNSKMMLFECSGSPVADVTTANHWYPAYFSSKLKQNEFAALELFGRPWVLFRDTDGKAGCILDQCAHRACPLSLGRVVDGVVECPYHGWKFNRNGECTKMPSTRMCKGIEVDSKPVREKDGLIWIWSGEGIPLFESPEISEEYSMDLAGMYTTELEKEVPVDHTILIESLDYVAQTPFKDLSSIAADLPLLQRVPFHATRLIVGDLKPDSEPSKDLHSAPGLHLSAFLAGEGKGRPSVFQLHSVVPVRPGHSRVLYRMNVENDALKGLSGLLPMSHNLWETLATRCFDHSLQAVIDATKIL